MKYTKQEWIAGCPWKSEGFHIDYRVWFIAVLHLLFNGNNNQTEKMLVDQFRQNNIPILVFQILYMLVGQFEMGVLVRMLTGFHHSLTRNLVGALFACYS